MDHLGEVEVFGYRVTPSAEAATSNLSDHLALDKYILSLDQKTSKEDLPFFNICDGIVNIL